MDYGLQHRKTHLPKDKECYGCVRVFSSFSAMLIHLEAGNCPSGTDKEMIDDLAFQLYQSKKYTNDRDDYYPYHCPGCYTNVRTVSGLFQHAESVPGCQRWLKSSNCLGKLDWFIYCRV